jgi:hypothetical protein
MKLEPFERFVGDDEVMSYIAIRGDEHRDGYIPSKSTIPPIPLNNKDEAILCED